MNFPETGNRPAIAMYVRDKLLAVGASYVGVCRSGTPLGQLLRMLS